MKRLWQMLGLVGVGGALLLSCNPPIEGELELLVDDSEHAAHSPRWSADGTKIYYILGEGSFWPDESGSLRVYDIEKRESSKINERDMWGFDISPSESIAVTWQSFWFWFLDLETGNIIDSLKPCEEAISHWNSITQPKFSLESKDLLYYSYSVPSDSVFLRRINLKDSTDEQLLAIQGSERVFAPGPGDTLLALNDTIYNLNNGEKYPIEIQPENLHWNPSVSSELLICSSENDNLFLFDLEERKAFKIKTETSTVYDIFEALFSPDGERIVLTSTLWGDGYVENKLWLFEPKE